jgi:hypothetical protein
MRSNAAPLAALKAQMLRWNRIGQIFVQPGFTLNKSTAILKI